MANNIYRQVSKLSAGLVAEVCKTMPQQPCLDILTAMLAGSAKHACLDVDHALQTGLKAATHLVSALSPAELERVI